MLGANPLQNRPRRAGARRSEANFGFTVAGEGASFRNLRVWEALPNPNWAATKKALAGAAQ